MELDKFKISYTQLKRESWVWRATMFFESVAVVFLAYLAFTKETVTVITPWTLQHSAWVGEEQASESYKLAWGMALAMMIGNTNYGSVDLLESRIAPLLPSDKYEATITALRAQAMQFKENRITSRFEILKYIFEPKTDKVFIEGFYYLKAPGLSEKRARRTYEFIIGMNQYMPQILFMDTYEDVAHTRQRLQQIEKEGKSK